MKKQRIKFDFLNKTTLKIVGVIIMILSAIALLWYGNANSMQAIPATAAQIYFEGEYRIGDEDWKEIKEGEHIPVNQGDVKLRGTFHQRTPQGEYWRPCPSGTPIAFYTNHIHLTFQDGERTFSSDCENPRIGVSACGEKWSIYAFTSTDPIVITIHNPHEFGNETAVDEMLSGIAFWTGADFEKGVLDNGESQRNIGLLFVIASVMFLGTALFSSLIHLKNSKTIWLFGLVSLFAGGYFTYSSVGISYWSESVISNTILLGASMIFYMFFLSVLVAYALKRTRVIGEITSVALGVGDLILFLLPMVTKLFFYDMLLYWAILQGVASIVLLACLVKEFIPATVKEKCICAGAALPFFAFGVDCIATVLGVWKGGVASKNVFIMLFVVAMVVVLRIIPRSINALAKAKELETEKLLLNAQLAESRVSTMMSQIRPHFIYNTLGSIEQLCELDPPKAAELVHNFAKYLRGNFGELDNPKPILMSQEMEHVHHYISIENVRFPDMTFTFEMNSNDFHIPALTIQPIVENAIKHGLMKLQKGGTIHVVSYETDTHYCVLVEDDGVGFDTTVLLDERKHVGIRNIRGRLKAMVNGTLEIESEIGVGTKVLIEIPKEVD